MSWARPDGSRATVALLDPLTGVPIPDAWVFPLLGSHAAGPLGQIELGDRDLERGWFPGIPHSRYLQFVRVEANDPDNPFLPRDNYVWVDRPTLLRCTSAGGSLQGTQWQLTWSPWRNDVRNVLAFSGWQGVPFSHQMALLPSAGLYVVRAAAIGVAQSFAVLAAFDATNPSTLRTQLPYFAAGAVVGQADVALSAGNTVIFSNVLAALPFVALDIINPTAATVRLAWGGAAAANVGIPLGPTGTEHDRIRFATDQIPLASLNAWKAASGTLSVIRYQ